MIYHNLWESDFIRFFDDDEQVVFNEDIKDVSLNGIFNLFTRSYLDMYQPLVSFSFMIENAIWGLNARGYHLVSLFWHILNLILLYRILTKLKYSDKDAFLVTLLVVGLAINVETVSWISARSTLMFSSFCLISIAFLLDYNANQQRNYLLYALLAFLLSLLSKVTGIVLVAIALLILWDALRQRKSEVIVFISLSITLAVTFIFIGTHFRSADSVGATLNLFTSTKKLFWYTATIIPAIRYSILYPQDILSYDYTWLGAGILGILTILFWFNRKSTDTRNCLKMVLVMIILISPFLIINTAKSPVNDRYAYLFSFAFCVLLFNVFKLIQPKHYIYLVISFTVFVGYKAWKTVPNWVSSTRVWENASMYPHNHEAYKEYIKILGKTGEYQKSFLVVDEIIKSYPGKAQYKILKAYNLYLSKQYNESLNLIEEIEKSYQHPDLLCLKAYNNLALLRVFTASDQINKAIELNPANGEYYYVRAMVNWYNAKPFCDDIRTSTLKGFRVDAEFLQRCKY